MKKKDIRAKNTAELQKMIEEAEMELIKLNAQIATGTTIKSPGTIKQLRKQIAKIKTLIREREH